MTYFNDINEKCSCIHSSREQWLDYVIRRNESKARDKFEHDVRDTDDHLNRHVTSRVRTTFTRRGKRKKASAILCTRSKQARVR